MSDDSSRPNSTSSTPPAVRSGGILERLRMVLGLKSATSTIREDLEDALTGTQAPDFSPEERAMLKNVLGLRGLRVDDVMVPRPDIISIPSTSTIGETLDIFRSAEHSRLPVYGETLDEPLGIIHIKDLLAHMTAQAVIESDVEVRGAYDFAKVNLSQVLSELDIVRNVLYVPPSMPAIDLLAQMQATRVHMALVIDEYGGTDGLVTIEDLVEMVVGDIEDEHDEDAVVMIQAVGDGFIADARVALEEVEATLGIDLNEEDAAEDVDTLGGLLVTIAGRVPVRGEIVSGPSDLEFEVLDADPRRIKKVRIVRRLEAAEGAAPRNLSPARERADTLDDTAGSPKS